MNVKYIQLLWPDALPVNYSDPAYPFQQDCFAASCLLVLWNISVETESTKGEKEEKL